MAGHGALAALALALGLALALLAQVASPQPAEAGAGLPGLPGLPANYMEDGGEYPEQLPLCLRETRARECLFLYLSGLSFLFLIRTLTPRACWKPLARF